MNLTEMYLLLFTDTLVTNLAINTSAELVIHSMKIFNSYNPYLIILVSTISFAFASSINYLLGLILICHKVLATLTNEDVVSSQNKIEQIRRSRYLLLFLALSAVPFFGKFILVFAGFCRINLSLTIAITVFSKLVYYSYFMLYQSL